MKKFYYCNYCNEAFKSFKECCEHEKNCSNRECERTIEFRGILDLEEIIPDMAVKVGKSYYRVKSVLYSPTEGMARVKIDYSNPIEKIIVEVC